MILNGNKVVLDKISGKTPFQNNEMVEQTIQGNCRIAFIRGFQKEAGKELDRVDLGVISLHLFRELDQIICKGPSNLFCCCQISMAVFPGSGSNLATLELFLVKNMNQQISWNKPCYMPGLFASRNSGSSSIGFHC